MLADVPGRLIVIDGIAGSGKSTLIQSLKTHLQDQGKRIFDLAEWTQNHQEPPTYDQIADHDVFFTFEPTKQWIGAAIRNEMSRADEPYDARALAQAFSLDRLLQYRRLIIPLLEHGATIIQDRSVSTSIVYQPIMENAPSLEELLALPGNALALAYAPTHLIITQLPPEKTIQRMSERADDSKGVFEQLELLKKTHERYLSPWFADLFSKRGSTLHHFTTDLPIEETQRNIHLLIDQLIT